jgi:hypothetical protein
MDFHARQTANSVPTVEWLKKWSDPGTAIRDIKRNLDITFYRRWWSLSPRVDRLVAEVFGGENDELDCTQNARGQRDQGGHQLQHTIHGNSHNSKWQ